jgi:putative glutamine amidotransferase
MSRPVVGILGNFHLINEQYPVQAVGINNFEAVTEVSGAVPIMIPAIPSLASIGELLDTCDGFMLPGGRPNVHPSLYGHDETPAHGAFDLDRDAVALELLRECVARAVPIFGICRGFQEFNVAFGGTLHPEIRDLPGRMNHRMPPDGTLEEKFEHRHVVTLTKGGKFARILGADEVLVNSLHGQGIEEKGARIVIEGVAPDGTAEAIHVEGAPSFAMAVQWHPEWQASKDPVSRPLFEAFGQALCAKRMRQSA